MQYSSCFTAMRRVKEDTISRSLIYMYIYIYIYIHIYRAMIATVTLAN